MLYYFLLSMSKSLQLFFWWVTLLFLCLLSLFSVVRNYNFSWIRTQTWIINQIPSVSLEDISYVGRISKYRRLDERGSSLSSSGILLAKWSGIFVHRRWYVLTNKHVVDDLQAHYEITFTGWIRFSIRHIWFHDTLDLALLLLSGNQEMFESLLVPSLSSSHYISDDQLVFGLTLSWTLFSGRMTSDEMSYRIDVPVSPGASGSPILDLSGSVLGIIYATTSRFSLAIPLSDVFVNQWIDSLSL